METLFSLLRRETPLEARDVQLISHMALAFPFLADLAHAELRLYTRSRETRELLLALSESPHTFHLERMETSAPRRVAALEEPLVADTLRTGRPARGKREWRYGALREIFTYPIASGERTIAVLVFETDLERLSLAGYEHLLHAAERLLVMARTCAHPQAFRPIEAGDGIIIADENRRIVFADAEAERIYRVLGIGALRGYRLFERSLSRVARRETQDLGTPWESEIEAGGLILIRRELIVREGGNEIARVILLTDVTETRQKDEELRIKSAIIQEIHHRVKNNLQTIASLLRLQARRAESPEVRAALFEGVDRILSISVVHEYLSRQGSEEIDVREVVRRLFDLVCQSALEAGRHVTFTYEGEPLRLPSKSASSVALVFNELLLNAMEHGFRERKEGHITLSVEDAGASYALTFTNDGEPFPAHLPQKKKSLGLTIIKTLAEGDLSGTFTIARGPDGTGATARLTIPKETEMLPVD